VKSGSFSLFENAIKSPQTKQVYTWSLHEFMKFTQIKEYNEIVKLTTDEIQRLLKSWAISLKRRNLRAITIKNKLCAVELFLEMYEVTFHKKTLHKLIPSDDYVPGGQKPFTTGEIQGMLNATTKLRTKALIHYLASTGTRPGHLSAKSVRQIVYNLIKQAGIERKKEGNRYDKAPVYGFRKRFNTILKINNDVNSNIAEKLMAHKRGLDGVYFQPTREQCFAEFQKAIPELVISDDARDKAKILKLEEEKSEIDKLKQRLTEMEENDKQVISDIAQLGVYFDSVFKEIPSISKRHSTNNPNTTTHDFPKHPELPDDELHKLLSRYPALAETVLKRQSMLKQYNSN
jgi:hypothetical protein